MSFDEVMFKANPNFKFKEVIRENTEALGNQSQFDVYKNKKGEVILICANFVSDEAYKKDHHICLINLSTNKEIKTIPYCERIMSIKYFQDPSTKKDYFVISDFNANIVIYDLDEDCKKIFDIETQYESFIYKNLIVFDQGKKYLITSSLSENCCTMIYDIDTQDSKALTSTTDLVTFNLDYWYNEKGEENEKHNIIHCAKGKLVVVTYPADNVYLEEEIDDEPYLQSGALFKKGEVAYYIFACTFGTVKVVNLETKDIVFNISHEEGKVHFLGITWWNEHYILINDCQQKQVVIMNIDNEDNFKIHGKALRTEDYFNKKIKKVDHPKYGESILTIGVDWKLRLYINRDIAGKEVE